MVDGSEGSAVGVSVHCRALQELNLLKLRN